MKQLLEQYKELPAECVIASLEAILRDKLQQKAVAERNLNLLKADITMLDNLIQNIKE
jgi:hypothetical protein